MIPTVTARAALAQSLFYDREKPVLAATCTALLLSRQWHQQEIAVRRLHRCIGQIAILERWQEAPKKGRSTTPLRLEPPTAGF